MPARRIHVPIIAPGSVPLDPAQAHHARHVLRLADGAAIEVFDDAGNTAAAEIHYPDDQSAVVAIEAVRPAPLAGIKLTVASAVPKADRADWLVEKLSELGVSRWIPLAAQRSVALPVGAGKRQRWQRIATESAKQSRRIGVMAIDELTPLDQAIAATGDAAMMGHAAGATFAAWVLSLAEQSKPIAAMLPSRPTEELTVFVGPEGGWTEAELRQFNERGIAAVRLGPTVLRIETAAMVVAAIVMSSGTTG